MLQHIGTIQCIAKKTYAAHRIPYKPAPKLIPHSQNSVGYTPPAALHGRRSASLLPPIGHRRPPSLSAAFCPAHGLPISLILYPASLVLKTVDFYSSVRYLPGAADCQFYIYVLSLSALPFLYANFYNSVPCLPGAEDCRFL
ncbi:hypothetical protein CDAR_56691 [Caerostris darwini]|uniref:Uncharacterized protein n=1 Tax=Caerostris darwini TaxID=1538125 RepID=A0AAV4Q083_9ARAC|nr:hypothetical protein CDAR_56691 [Caerostris darwini]